MNPFYPALDLALSFVQGFPAWALDHLRYPAAVMSMVAVGIAVSVAGIAFLRESAYKQSRREIDRFHALQQPHEEHA